LTEKKIIQKLCPDSPVRMTNLNGKSVSIPAIAKRISSFLTLLKGRYYPVLILVDREGRPETSEAIEEELVRELVGQYGCKPQDIVVSCPDRMIENWMLADAELLKRRFEVEIP